MLTQSWTDPKSLGAVAASAVYTVPQAVAAGRLLVIAVGTGAGTAQTYTAVDSRGNTYATLTDFGLLNTFTVGLIACKLTTALQIGDTITITRSAVANQRWPAVFGVFDDVPGAVVATGTSEHGVSSDDATVDLGPTASTADANSLVLAAVISTIAGGNWASSPTGDLVGSATSTVGTADRTTGLFYDYQPAGTHSLTCVRSGGSGSWSGVLASVAVPALVTADAWEWDGATEVPLQATEWNGSAEVALSAAIT